MKNYLCLFLIIFTSFIYCQSNDKSNNMSSYMGSGSISVTIGGDFIVTGTYPAFITERVDQFVTRMFEQAKENMLAQLASRPELMPEARKEIESYSIRNILLKRSSGEEYKLDLLKFRVNGDFVNNPYLKNDDVLIFPASDIERNFISVLGAVNKPGVFHYRDGDKLSDAIELAQGIDKSYENIQNCEISRLSYDGEKMETITVNINDDTELKRGDRVRVLADETQRKDFKVTVLGEVRMPGDIPIKKEFTTLKEVIEKCGGFTDNADLRNAQLLRGANVFKSLLFSEEIEQLLMMRMSTLIEEDSMYFKIDEKLRFLRGNANVDFTKLADNDFKDTLMFVKDKDVIYIPSIVNLVYVYGQVNQPSYVNYQSNKDFNYYITQAGGLGETAGSEVYLINGKTRTWYSADEVKEKNIVIEPGDYIWVTKQPVRTFWYHVEQASKIAAVVGGIATVILLFIQASK